MARVFAWEALDSRGNPTVGCEVTLRGGASGMALAPAGASVGKHEAVELRDGGDRYGGKGVRRAIASIDEVLGPAIIGLDSHDPAVVDGALEACDSNPNLREVGANAAVAMSLATWQAAAADAGSALYEFAAQGRRPLLPLPMVNVLSGGAHAGGMLDIQDVLAVPIGAESFSEAMEWVWRVRRAAVEMVNERGFAAALVADEGGVAAPLATNEGALALVAAAAERAGFRLGIDVALALDVAATQLGNSVRGYRLSVEDRILDSPEFWNLISSWCRKYAVVSVEDPLGEDDWITWKAATDSDSDRQLLGDDLFATNVDRLRRGIREGIANAVLIKPNQAGTISRAERVLRLAHTSGYATVLSARSGDTEDSWLADLAVGWRCGQIKVGSTARSERTTKWNRLLYIEKRLHGVAEYAGSAALAHPASKSQLQADRRNGP